MPRRDPNHIPRPENCFMLYKRDIWAEVVATLPKKSHCKEIVRVISQRWKGESPERREWYAALAREVKQKHAEKHPGYKYRPRKKGQPRVTSDSISPTSVETPSTSPERVWNSQFPPGISPTFEAQQQFVYVPPPPEPYFTAFPLPHLPPYPYPAFPDPNMNAYHYDMSTTSTGSSRMHATPSDCDVWRM